MSDMRQTIVPKSDQLNADDLIAGEMTIKITGVTIRGGQEQPVSIHFEGDNGKPYKACKSMCRVLVSAWGPDSTKYVGRSMTLYRDQSVKWAGMEVGGIRISHMSDIQGNQTMALTVTRGSKKPYTVKPLTVDEVKKSGSEPTAKVISDAQRRRLEARVTEVGIDREKVKRYIKKAFAKEHFAELTKPEYDIIDKMLTDYVPAAPSAETDPMLTKIAACTALDALEVIADAFTDDEAVRYLKAYTAKKSELLDAAAGGQV